MKNALLVAAALLGMAAIGLIDSSRADDERDTEFLTGRLVAAGIPGVSAIALVGAFPPGGPVHDNPALPADTQTGRIIDPARVLVASTSNFGGPPADASQLPRSILSIDPRGSNVLVIPPQFAAGGGQASALGGLVQIYRARNAAFRNSIENPRREPPQAIPGALHSPAAGAAFLGQSPDGSGKAVFAVVCADGSIVQEQTPRGYGGLAPAGTISPLVGRRWTDEDEDNRATSPGVGVLLNYSPKRILYVSEPYRNSIAALTLSEDSSVSRVASVRRISSPTLNRPVDLAPVAIETTNPHWASNTTLGAQSDFYAANRGDNTIVRMRQNGTVVAVRRVRLAGGKPLGSLRLNGIAGSPDGTRIWVALTGHISGSGSLRGAVLELPAF